MSRGLGDVYKRQIVSSARLKVNTLYLIILYYNSSLSTIVLGIAHIVV